MLSLAVLTVVNLIRQWLCTIELVSILWSSLIVMQPHFTSCDTNGLCIICVSLLDLDKSSVIYSVIAEDNFINSDCRKTVGPVLQRVRYRVSFCYTPSLSSSSSLTSLFLPAPLKHVGMLVVVVVPAAYLEQGIVLGDSRSKV